MSKRSAVLAGLTTGLLLLLSPADGQGQGQNPFSALPQTVDAPPDNPLTADKVALGTLLFWDPILSGHRDVACATCHHPQFRLCRGPRSLDRRQRHRLWLEPALPARNSIPFVKRNSQTMLNVAFNGVDQAGTRRRRADVLGRAREKPRSAGARADQVVRGDARRRVSRRQGDRDGRGGELNAIPEYRALFGKAFGAANVTAPSISARRSPRSGDRLSPTTRRSIATCAATAAR